MPTGVLVTSVNSEIVVAENSRSSLRKSLRSPDAGAANIRIRNAEAANRASLRCRRAAASASARLSAGAPPRGSSPSPAASKRRLSGSRRPAHTMTATPASGTTYNRAPRRDVEIRHWQHPHRHARAEPGAHHQHRHGPGPRPRRHLLSSQYHDQYAQGSGQPPSHQLRGPQEPQPRRQGSQRGHDAAADAGCQQQAAPAVAVGQGHGGQSEQHAHPHYGQHVSLGGVAVAELVGCECEGLGEHRAQVAVHQLHGAQQAQHGGAAGVQPVGGCPPVAVGVPRSQQSAPDGEMEQPGPHGNGEPVGDGLGQFPRFVRAVALSIGAAGLRPLEGHLAFIVPEGSVLGLEAVVAHRSLGHDVVSRLPACSPFAFHLGRTSASHDPQDGHDRSSVAGLIVFSCTYDEKTR